MKKIMVFLVLLLTIIAQAQDYRFGKVSKAELENKQHKLEPEANAAILYKEEKVHFIFSKQDGFIQNKDVYVRLKIYNKEGYEYATKKIKFYDETSSLKEKILEMLNEWIRCLISISLMSFLEIKLILEFQYLYKSIKFSYCEIWDLVRSGKYWISLFKTFNYLNKITLINLPK